MSFHTLTATAPWPNAASRSLLRVRQPAGPLAARGVECRREGDAVRVGATQGDRVVQLLRERRKVRVVDVDREDAEAVLLRALREFRHLPVQVHVHVDLLERGEVLLRVVRPRRRGLEQGASERDDRREAACFQRKTSGDSHCCWSLLTAAEGSGLPAIRAA